MSWRPVEEPEDWAELDEGAEIFLGDDFVLVDGAPPEMDLS